jgi:hypothetical protein
MRERSSGVGRISTNFSAGWTRRRCSWLEYSEAARVPAIGDPMIGAADCPEASVAPPGARMAINTEYPAARTSSVGSSYHPLSAVQLGRYTFPGSASASGLPSQCGCAKTNPSCCSF